MCACRAYHIHVHSVYMSRFDSLCVCVGFCVSLLCVALSICIYKYAISMSEVVPSATWP